MGSLQCSDGHGGWIDLVDPATELLPQPAGFEDVPDEAQIQEWRPRRRDPLPTVALPAPGSFERGRR